MMLILLAPKVRRIAWNLVDDTFALIYIQTTIIVENATILVLLLRSATGVNANVILTTIFAMGYVLILKMMRIIAGLVATYATQDKVA